MLLRRENDLRHFALYCTGAAPPSPIERGLSIYNEYFV